MNMQSLQHAKRIYRGNCLIECAAGGVFLIIVALFLLDGIGVVFANSLNDRVAFNAARAAANAAESDARGAAETMIANQSSERRLIRGIKMVSFRYIPKERVEVTTEMNVALPAPVLGLPQVVSFKARAIQSIISTAPVVSSDAGHAGHPQS
jgi:hypothetical protein